MEEINNEHVITLFEACEMLNKSARTVSRYVRKGFLNPASIKSRKGTMEYRFSRAELEDVKNREDEIRQVTFAEEGEASESVAARFASLDSLQSLPAIEIPLVDPVASGLPDTPDMAGQTGQQPSSGAEIESRIEKLEQVAEAKTSGEEKLAGDIEIPRPDQEIIDLLKETTGMLRDQLYVKDEQIRSLNDKIDNLIERDRETNILLKGLQDKFLYLEKPKAESGRSNIEKAEINEAPVSPVKSVKENKDEGKGKNGKKTNGGLSGNKESNKSNKERQDTTDKQNNQKKSGSDKPKKGFWGGLFGK